MFLLQFKQLPLKLFRDSASRKETTCALIALDSLNLFVLDLQVLAECQCVAEFLLQHSFFLLDDLKVAPDLPQC
jgi:hypothetical protein